MQILCETRHSGYLKDGSVDDLGKIIKTAREKTGLSVQEVSNKIKILSSYLEAIENNDFQSLPPRVYVVGFVRCYADFLNLDSQKLCGILREKLGWRDHSDLFYFEQKGGGSDALPEVPSNENSYGRFAAYAAFIACLLIGSVFFLR